MTLPDTAPRQSAPEIATPPEVVPDARVAVLQSEAPAPEAINEAFAAIVDEFEQRLTSNLTRMVGSDRAEDLVQETFLRAFTAVDRFENTGNEALSRWLYTIARNLARNEMRGAKDVPLPDPEMVASQHGQFGDPVAEQSLRETIDSLREVNPLHRDTLMLSILGLSIPEIAERRNESHQATSAHLVRGRKSARRILNRPDTEVKFALARSA